jgi:hypothetical protein
VDKWHLTSFSSLFFCAIIEMSDIKRFYPIKTLFKAKNPLREKKGKGGFFGLKWGEKLSKD